MTAHPPEPSPRYGRIRSPSMADPANHLSREEVMGGLPARRARTLLFLIEQQAARHAAEREVGTMALIGEGAAEARELGWIEAFALGRERRQTTSAREIEASAQLWASLVPESPAVRATVLRLLTERYELDPERVPGIRGALGSDDDRVAAAFQRLTGDPI